jgi:hypothetical protein
MTDVSAESAGCGNVETWTDADNIESGNINAPAPGHC